MAACSLEMKRCTSLACSTRCSQAIANDSISNVTARVPLSQRLGARADGHSPPVSVYPSPEVTLRPSIRIHKMSLNVEAVRSKNLLTVWLALIPLQLLDIRSILLSALLLFA